MEKSQKLAKIKNFKISLDLIPFKQSFRKLSERVSKTPRDKNNAVWDAIDALWHSSVFSLRTINGRLNSIDHPILNPLGKRTTPSSVNLRPPILLSCFISSIIFFGVIPFLFFFLHSATYASIFFYYITIYMILLYRARPRLQYLGNFYVGDSIWLQFHHKGDQMWM